MLSETFCDFQTPFDVIQLNSEEERRGCFLPHHHVEVTALEVVVMQKCIH